MVPISFSSTAYLWSLVGLTILLYTTRRSRQRFRLLLPLPPGPKKLPIVGNLFDVPADRPWEAYQQWNKDFRDRWRRQRKMFHEAFHAGAVKQFDPQIRDSTHRLLRRLLRDPHDLMGHFRHLAGALIMDVTYGIDVESLDDPYIKIAEEALHGLAIACVPGTFMVVRLASYPAHQDTQTHFQDLIPALKYVPSWFPGAEFKRKARQWRDVTHELVEAPFTEVKRNVAAGTAPFSFTSLNLGLLAESDSGSKRGAVKEKDIKETAAASHAAGADTTTSAMGTFALAMLKNPDAQKKAQAELDAVIGHGNLPELGDAPALPYVSAIVKEVLRWENVAPIGIPHRLLVEDEYRGFRIPENSIVIGNEMYPDPKSFKPERFLLGGKLNSDVRDPEAVIFGFGRRICPGRHMAYSSLWLTIASILATFDINKAVDNDGNVIEPSYEYSAAVIFTPLPFKCSVTPRSPRAAQAIEATVGGKCYFK
ncbi:Cytochrome P450 [Mycena venus]|uniref:Cytochrome P450 n=1 Tax=Mycena venus TaxID=2733690 RepID=A0A8H7DBK8_9AGAR|nr:Cytochrome P450 [Mycena venus]